MNFRHLNHALCLLASLIIGLGSTPNAFARKLPTTGLDQTAPKPLPEVPFFDEVGNSLYLDDFKGKVLVVNFWATWCGPCIEEMPSLARMKKELAPHGVEVIAISVDFGGAKVVKSFMTRNKLNFEPYVDEKGVLMSHFDSPGLPTTVVISPKGEEIARVTGAIDWDNKKVRDYLLAQKTAD